MAFYDLVKRGECEFACLFATGANTLWRSTDFGETWSQVAAGVYLPAGYTTTGARIAVTRPIRIMSTSALVAVRYDFPINRWGATSAR